jgi:hypothetical protein
MKRCVIRWLLLQCATLLPVLGWAQGAPVSEHALKSALFFKLPQFVYRADEARDRPLAVCLMGGAAFALPFEKLAQSPIDGRPVAYTKLPSLNDATRCDFVFVAQSEAGTLDALVKRLVTLSAVSVSDAPGFAKAGGMVELAMGAPGAPVSILINRKAAKAQNIEFNAQLLRLAKVVEP